MRGERAPRVSVVVPVFNRRTFLEECVRSILATQYPNLEILLIDDGSKDGSLELGESLAKSSPEEIIALHHENHENRGISASRNLGISKASGRYLAFLDSDDCYESNRFSQCIQKLEEESRLIAVIEPVLVTHEDQSQPDRLVPTRETLALAKENSLRLLFHNEWWLMPGITLRTEELRRMGAFRPDLPVAEDIELWMRIAASGSLGVLSDDNPVAIVQRHSAGHSWDGYPTTKRQRLYRRALIKARDGVNKNKKLYLPMALMSLRRRYQQAVRDELAELSHPPETQAFLMLFAEVALNQPTSFLNKAIIVDAAVAIREIARTFTNKLYRVFSQLSRPNETRPKK